MASKDNDLAGPIHLSETSQNDGPEAFAKRAAAKYEASMGQDGFTGFLAREGDFDALEAPPPLTAAKVRRFSDAFQASAADPEIKRDIALAAESLIKNLPSVH